MSKKHLYFNGAVHLDHSHSLEINQQNLSAEELSRIIHTLMHDDAPGYTANSASSPMPVYVEEVVCETIGRQEAETLARAQRQEAEALIQARRQEAEALIQARQALAQAQQVLAQARQQEAEALAQARQAQEQIRQAQEQARQMQEQAQQMQEQAQAAQSQAEASLTLAEWLKELIHNLRQDGVLKRQYDFTWVMWGVNHAAGRMLFASNRSFLDYLTDCGIDQLPSIASLQSHNQNFSLHEHPDQWTFRDNQDEQERQRRIRVGKYTIHSFHVSILTNK